MRHLSLLIIAWLFIVGTSCKSKKSGDEGTETDTAKADTGNAQKEQMKKEKEALSDYLFEKNGLKISVVESPKFPNANLALLQPGDKTQVSQGKVHFKFDVNHYELGVQTSDAKEKGMANSSKGQHIHLILNNGPYSAHYQPEFNKALEDGHYVCLAFPSRSYHESVKSTFVITQFTVGDAEPEEVDLSGPMLFYSRPKGEYSGEDTRKILLDFFLVNTSLTPEGPHVRATINETEFLFKEWKPYAVEGLSPGTVKIKLELVDREGNLIDSPFNSVEREIELKQGA